MQILKYKDLINIPVKENKEDIVEIKTNTFSHGFHEKKLDLNKELKGKILARKSVILKLEQVQKNLTAINPNYKLHIFEGYRPLKIQTQRFNQRLAIISADNFYKNPIDLYEKVHETVAVPTVAGHPTGGAIDLVIIDTKTNKQIDFGSEIYDYSNDNYKSFCQKISDKAKQNRKLLRSLMIQENFAPFDGEYWHFSYGDQEWAAFYNKPNAIYSQINLVI